MTLRASVVTRLVLSFLAPSLVLLGLAAPIVYLRALDALRQATVERLEAEANAKQVSIEAWIDHELDDLAWLARLEPLAERLAGLPAGGAAGAELTALLTRAVEERASLDELFVLSPTDGRVLASTVAESVGTSRAYDRFYVEGRRRPFVQELHRPPAAPRSRLTMAVPVRRLGDGLVGVLAAHVSLEPLDRRVLQRIGHGPGARVTLVDRDGTVLAGAARGVAAPERRGGSAAIRRVVAGEEGWGFYDDPTGRPVIGLYRWLGDHQLGLIVEIARDDALGGADRMAVAFLAGGGAIVSVLVAVLYLVARRIARPILDIGAAAAEVGRGNLEIEAPVTTHDEIGALAQTFNEMVAELRRLYEQMSDRIEQLQQVKGERERLIADLEASNLELERFNFTVSHDLKNPLVTIAGFLGVLEADLRRGDEAAVGRDLDVLRSACERMRSLLEDLLQLSRAGGKGLVREPLDQEALAREAFATAVAATGGSEAEIVVEPGLPGALADAGQVRELWINLLDNALKFSPSAPCRVRVGWRSEGDETVYTVRDEGIGIEPSRLKQIFGLFERLDPTVPGTGVGLAIVLRIVERHGGRVWAESPGLGRGATFCFTLPTRQR